MNKFVAAATGKPEALTENGAVTFATSQDPNVDLFSLIGSLSKGNSNRVNANALFNMAFAADPEKATRIMLWSRDIRGGGGRRQVFRDWLQHIETTQPELCALVIPFVPVYGRWDDLLVLRTGAMKDRVNTLIIEALRAGHGLAAKWMPRTGRRAVELARAMRLARPEYGDATFLRRWRRDLAKLSKTVEQQMSAGQWAEINYDHVPGVAMLRYRKAFGRHDYLRYGEWLESLKKAPVEKKMNVETLYPFNIVSQLANGHNRWETNYGRAAQSDALLEEQWRRLPNFIQNANILAIADVSGSMTSEVQGKVRALDVAISLGLYVAEKNKGPFNGIVVNFSDKSELVHLTGKTLREKANQVAGMAWGGSTNVQAAFDNILNVALTNRVPAEDMPTHLVIVSDMEFNSCGGRNTNLEVARMKFERAGYRLPKIVFWNVNGRQGNSPARAFDQDIALISGFSPAIMGAVLGAKHVTPVEVMEKAIMKDRYNIWEADPANVPKA